MLQIVLIRPGTTDFDEQGRIQGTLDIPLNEQGSQQVEQTIEQLRDGGIEAIYTSDCEPALQTAERLADALDVKLKKLPKMQNLDHGLWQGMLIEEVRQKQPKVYRQWQEQPGSVCPPQGEKLSQAQQRVQAAISWLLKKHKQGTIGLVVPEPMATLVRCHLGHQEPRNLWRSGIRGENWELLEAEPRTPAHTGR